MTARTMPTEAICCADGCGKLGAYTVGAKVWAVDDPGKERGALEITTTMVVCEEHRLRMPTTCPEFFTEDSRRMMTAAVRAGGRPDPDFDRAQWMHAPVPTPTKKAAH